MLGLEAIWLRKWHVVTRNWHRWLWTLALVLWTVALTTPQPAQATQAALPDDSERYLAHKAAHVGVYAAFVASAGLLGVFGWTRWLFPLGMIGHGMLTEYIQTFVPGRYGCWADVGFDTSGVLLGLGLGWLLGWWRWTG
jgi:VanZ family protein